MRKPNVHRSTSPRSAGLHFDILEARCLLSGLQSLFAPHSLSAPAVAALQGSPTLVSQDARVDAPASDSIPSSRVFATPPVPTAVAAELSLAAPPKVPLRVPAPTGTGAPAVAIIAPIAELSDARIAPVVLVRDHGVAAATQAVTTVVASLSTSTAADVQTSVAPLVSLVEPLVPSIVNQTTAVVSPMTDPMPPAMNLVEHLVNALVPSTVSTPTVHVEVPGTPADNTGTVGGPGAAVALPLLAVSGRPLADSGHSTGPAAAAAARAAWAAVTNQLFVQAVASTDARLEAAANVPNITRTQSDFDALILVLHNDIDELSLTVPQDDPAGKGALLQDSRAAKQRPEGARSWTGEESAQAQTDSAPATLLPVLRFDFSPTPPAEVLSLAGWFGRGMKPFASEGFGPLSDFFPLELTGVWTDLRHAMDEWLPLDSGMSLYILVLALAAAGALAEIRHRQVRATLASCEGADVGTEPLFT